MRVLTPAQYAQAYQLLVHAEQRADVACSRATAARVGAQLAAHSIRVEAEQVRRAAVDQYQDDDETLGQRQRDLLRADAAWHDDPARHRRRHLAAA